MDGYEITAELNADALTQAHEEHKKAAPDVVARVTMGARTDLGRIRDNNEDKFDYVEPEDPETLANNGSLYAVADGMGGHAAGQIASEFALKTLLKTYYSVTSRDAETRLKAAISEANAFIYDAACAIPDRSGMGTTLVVAVIREADLFIAHVGDSRAYMIRGDKIARLTRDHSWVEEQVARGSLTEEEALQSPFRNVITRSLGTEPTVETDVSNYRLADGDRILMCSDGLTGHLSDDDLLKLAGGGAPSQAAVRLVDAANERGGRDNITVMLLRVEGIGGEGEPLPRSETSIQLDEGSRKPAGWFSRIFKLR